MPNIVVIGGGGHARVTIEALRAQARFNPVGFTDANATISQLFGVPRLGTDDALPDLARQGTTRAVIAIGNNAARQRIAERLRTLGFELPPIIHPTALLSPSTTIAAGAVIMAGAIVGTDTRIGELAIINTGAIVDHDSTIGTASHVAPGCALAGNVRVGARVLIGIGSSVKPGIRIADDVTIGAGSAVVRDVAAGSVVGGAPARLISSHR